MKPIITILLLAVSVLQAYTGEAKDKTAKRKNYIDSIRTAEQIESLVTRTDNRFYEFRVSNQLESLIRDCKELADSLGVKPWAKADFDNNGLTDIMVVGATHPRVLFILDKGNKYELKYIWRSGLPGCVLPRVVTEDGTDKVEIYIGVGGSEKMKLVYKFGDFIEENVQPANHKIEKIEYSTSGCYGPCPIFEMTINGDKSVVWEAKRFNEINSKEIKGTFKTSIDDAHYNEIVGLLNYIDFERLNGNYSANWTDDESINLKITYDNGKTKNVNDYGHLVPFGLKRLYKLLADLRENQNWVE